LRVLLRTCAAEGACRALTVDAAPFECPLISHAPARARSSHPRRTLSLSLSLSLSATSSSDPTPTPGRCIIAPASSLPSLAQTRVFPNDSHCALSSSGLMDSPSPAPGRRALDVAIWRTPGRHALFIPVLLHLRRAGRVFCSFWGFRWGKRA